MAYSAVDNIDHCYGLSKLVGYWTVHVPFIDLRPYVNLVRTHGSAFVDDVEALLDTRDFIGSYSSETVRRFETALATKLGVSHVVGCANGTDALQLALRAAGIERGHRVAIPNLTFWATYEAVVNVGATPVLLDIDPVDKQMSYTEFVTAHGRRHFDAAILVHLLGWCSERLADFRLFCRDHRITLIEDGAQAFGVEYDGQSVFADADAATLSFHPAKVLGGIGDGGAVICRTERMANRVRLYANHGRLSHFDHGAIGCNSRLDAIHAAWLLRALGVIDDVIADRRVTLKEYGSTRPSSRVVGNGYLDVRYTSDSATATEFVERMKAVDVGISRAYPKTIADQIAARHTAVCVGDLECSRDHACRAVSRPVWYGMSAEEITHVTTMTGAWL